MKNERTLVLAAMQWHVLYSERIEVGKRRSELRKAIPKGAAVPFTVRDKFSDFQLEITELKRKERVALRALAKICSEIRGQFEDADVIDV